MSWSLSAYVKVDGQCIDICEGWNYTHNTNGMLKEAGLIEWPYAISGMGCTELVTKLTKGIEKLKAEPDKYRAMNPENGWGDYDGLLAKLKAILEVAIKFPSAQWHMNA